MFTFATNIATHDLVIRNRDLVRITDIAALRRWVEHRLLSIRGDWFEEESDGIAYFDTDDPEILVAQMKASIMEITDVLEIPVFDWSISNGNTLVVSRIKIRTRSGAEGSIAALSVPVG